MDKIFNNLISYKGNFGRIAFILHESYRGIAVLFCFLLFKIGLKWLAILLLPAAIWIGVVATIKRFNDLKIDLRYILVVLMVIAAGIGLAVQFTYWPLALTGLIPYLLYVCLKPGSQKKK